MAEVSEELQFYASVINGLHAKFTPHDEQVQVGRWLFANEIKDIFLECGRNWGKTDLIRYCLWRWAKFHPYSENYYFSPFAVQTREIMWAPQLLQNFGPPEWILSKNDTEMRLTFTNGSFIKCAGSDNFEAYRGVKPKGLTILDEFKDFRPEFYDSYDPNRAAFKAPMIIMGTSPERRCQFSTVRDEYKSNPKKKYFHGTIYGNPHIDREWIEEKKNELIKAGDEDKWQREYMAMEVHGGQSKIFPMLTGEVFEDHEVMLKKIHKDRKRIEWVWWADPAAASVFGVLFVAFNPYTRELYCLDEIYETSQAEMTVKKVGEKIVAKKEDLEDEAEWREGCDEAATWFRNEMVENFGIGVEPSQKASNDKEDGLSLIKDLILQKKLHLSKKCMKLFWEMDNYYKDKNGKIPKVNDHLIDCLRYIIAAVGYSFNEEKYVEPNVIDPNEDIFNEKRKLQMQFKDDDYSSFERE